ncbi:hypothetical protein KR093_006623 [Drosophila rubida]|uniref:Prothoracicotropic hormone n=1 Tax=Drosophila rubida TaxID=30044 RepID=A0AAD4JVH0_9MUSC|nr:hypothetical protein KR093_006623 [Drosophila rubida]
MATLLAALALRCLVDGHRFAAYDELQPPPPPPPKRCSRFLDCAGQPAIPAMPAIPDAEADVDVDVELTAGHSKMLSALFGTPATPHATAAALTPHQLPPMYYNDFYEDLLTSKRNDVHAAGCDCKVMNDLIDLGSTHFPRYLMSAVCESRPARDAKCTQGSNCKPLEYKVKVLTLIPEQLPAKTAAASSSATHSRLWLPEDMPQPWQWQFKTVTVTAGCFCTN